MVAHIPAAGQHPRPRRLALMIAATTHANDLPLFTRNLPEDLDAARSTVTIVAI